jgi:hypothetical protein
MCNILNMQTWTQHKQLLSCTQMFVLCGDRSRDLLRNETIHCAKSVDKNKLLAITILYLSPLIVKNLSTNPHWACVVGYGPVSLRVIHRKACAPAVGTLLGWWWWWLVNATHCVYLKQYLLLYLISSSHPKDILLWSIQIEGMQTAWVNHVRKWALIRELG